MTLEVNECCKSASSYGVSEERLGLRLSERLVSARHLLNVVSVRRLTFFLLKIKWTRILP